MIETTTMHAATGPDRARSLATAAALAAIWLALTGCGGSNTPGTAGDGSDVDAALNPCQLVPAAQLSTITGAAVTEIAGPTPEALGLTCAFEYPLAAGQIGAGEIHVTAWQGREFYTPDAMPEYGTPVSGIGDAASGDEQTGWLIFRSGEHVVQIQVFGPAKDAITDIGRAAAEHTR